MKVAELRKMIGKVIQWEDTPDAAEFSRVRSGTLEGAIGRNVIVNGDYYWLPKMRNIKLKEDDNGSG